MLHNPDFPDEITVAGTDTRNVIDPYKGWGNEQIRQDLRARCAPAQVIVENFAHDFNIGTVVRNANAFNLAGVTIAGRRRWDRRGAVGTQSYTPVAHTEDILGRLRLLKSQGFVIVAVDNVPGAVDLPQHRWSARSVLVFGQESIGVSNLALSLADAVVAVPQLGSVRSLNVGTASGIVMYDYIVRSGALDGIGSAPRAMPGAAQVTVIG